MKWYGIIGFAEKQETKPGVYKDVITERSYYGDVVKDYKKDQSADKLNDNLTISNNLSIVCDPYAMQNFHKIRYIEFMGTKWKVSSVENQYPRLIIQMGSVFNGDRKKEG